MSWLDRLTDPATITALAGLITAATALVTAWRAKTSAATALARLDAQAKRMTLLEDADSRAVVVDKSPSGRP